MGFWKGVFATAAAFNFAVGLILLFAPATVLATVGIVRPDDTFFMDLAALLIIAFGLAYLVVAWKPPAQRAIVALSVIGKATVPMITWLHVVRGDVTMDTFLLALGDLGFAALFVMFLLQTRRATA